MFPTLETNRVETIMQSLSLIGSRVFLTIGDEDYTDLLIYYQDFCNKLCNKRRILESYVVVESNAGIMCGKSTFITDFVTEIQTVFYSIKVSYKICYKSGDEIQ